MRLIAGLLLVGLWAPMPAEAQDACQTWHAAMEEDEGGPRLVASACAVGRPDAWLALTCSAGRVNVRYDLAAGAEAEPELNEAVDVGFSIGGDQATILMTYEPMDGRHAATVGAEDRLMALLRKGRELVAGDTAGRYPEWRFSLAGSSAAIGKILDGCR